MSNTIETTTLILLVIGNGMLAGLCFVFSNFTMQALASLPHTAGAAAMRAINRKIINPWFIILFSHIVAARRQSCRFRLSRSFAHISIREKTQAKTRATQGMAQGKLRQSIDCPCTSLFLTIKDS